MLAPDVIKLGIDLVQSRLSDHGALTVAGVLAHQERTGAVILAEGVETDAHLERARAVGATRYRKLGAGSVLVAVFGERLPRGLGHGVRTVTLDSADPLRDEWIVVALGPDISAALIAREQPGSTRQNGDREFDLVLTYDRESVTTAARALMYRLV